MSSSEFRLPGDIIPLHYDLNILTNLEEDKSTFSGNARIKIKCLKPTDTIKIHARDLTFEANEVSITSENKSGMILPVVNTSMDTKNEFYIIKTSETLAIEQEYSLYLPFEGLLKNNLIGYYRSSYYDKSSGTTKLMAVTHFEPSDARQAFPCFDEPGLKTSFTIRLAHDEKYKGVSNMPLKSTVPYEKKQGWVLDEFVTTVPMSTYLVAYMVSELDFKEESKSSSGVTFRVWARQEAIGQSEFPSMVGPRFLTFYEDFFSVPYPLTKLDLLAIPDFKIGGMENWGIITFRESSLLLDEKITSSTEKVHIASIIAHELAHMWFGNLVTMRWWTDLWLKEGFATYMASLAVHHEFPEWNSLDAEGLSDLLDVFKLDSLKSSHPVSVPIGHSSEISQIFDAISYDKGSFLLRMMSLFLGEEVFRHAVTTYLLEHKYNNADQDNLWSSLTVQAHRYSVLPPDLTVKQIMDTWTLQTGYPLITVKRDYGSSKVHVSQKRYLATSSDNPSDYEGSWWVPLSYSSSKEPHFNRTQPEHWLSKDKKFVVLDVKADKGDWLIFNNRAAGLYKVNYDLENWELLIDILNSKRYKDIDVMNRALLIVDAMDLANSGILDYKLALELISYVEIDTEFVPWIAVLNKLVPLKTKLCRTPSFGTFKKFVKTLMEPIVKSLGDLTKEPASFEKARFINLVSHWACQLNIGECKDVALALFKQWRNSDDPDDVNPIPKDIRSAVYANAVAVGGEDAFDFLWERYQKANVIAEKNNILIALTNAKDTWLINRYLEWTLKEESGIRKQDAFLIFQETANKDIGFVVAQKFFTRNIKHISDFFGNNSNLIGRYFSAISNQIIYREEYEELKTFSEIHKDLLAPASLTVKQALESVQLNIKWIENHYDTITLHMNRITESRDVTHPLAPLNS